MNYFLIPKADFSYGRKVLRCALILTLLICFAGCSSSDDYEIFAKIHGTVTDYQTGAPLENVSVTLSPSGLSRQTDANGYYQFDELDSQQYTITAQRAGYQPNRKTVTAISGENQRVDIQLTIIPQ